MIKRVIVKFINFLRWGVAIFSFLMCAAGIEAYIKSKVAINIVLAVLFAVLGLFILFSIIKNRFSKNITSKIEPIENVIGVIQVGDMTAKINDSIVTEEEVPLLIKHDYEKVIGNEKPNRTPKDDDLSFNFSQKYSEKIEIMEEGIYNSSAAIGKTLKKWKNQASKAEINEKIALCKTAILNFERMKEFCYKRGKGGQIYFQDMWEYCHNSKNPCFSFIDSTIELKMELEKLLENKQ